jgi:hypothetical protein
MASTENGMWEWRNTRGRCYAVLSDLLGMKATQIGRLERSGVVRCARG